MAKKRNTITADVVQAQSIELVDQKGKTKAELFATDFATIIHLLDKKGRPRLVLQVDCDGNPSINLFDTENVPAITVGVMEENGRGITIQDGLGNHVSLGIPQPGQPPGRDQPDVKVFDGSKKKFWSAMSD